MKVIDPIKCKYKLSNSVCEGCLYKEQGHNCTKKKEHNRTGFGIHKVVLDCFTIPHNLKKYLGNSTLQNMHRNMPLCTIFCNEMADTPRETEMRRVLATKNLSCNIFAQTKISELDDADKVDIIELLKKIGQENSNKKCIRTLKKITSSSNSHLWYEQDAGNNIGKKNSLLIHEKKIYLENINKFINDFSTSWSSTRYMHGDLHEGNITYSAKENQFKIIDLDFLSPVHLKTDLIHVIEHLHTWGYCSRVNDFKLLMIKWCVIYLPPYSYEVVFRENIGRHSPEIALFILFLLDESEDKQKTKIMFNSFIGENKLDGYALKFDDIKKLYDESLQQVSRFISQQQTIDNLSSTILQVSRLTSQQQTIDNLSSTIIQVCKYCDLLEKQYPDINFLFYEDMTQLLFSLRSNVNTMYSEDDEVLLLKDSVAADITERLNLLGQLRVT